MRTQKGKSQQTSRPSHQRSHPQSQPQRQVASSNPLITQIYTSGKNLPTPFTRSTYYHRSINPKKLIEVKFSALAQNQTMAMVKKLYAIPD